MESLEDENEFYSGYDFPGTFCKGIILKKYFEFREEAWESVRDMEYRDGEKDCVFMEYLHKQNNYYKEDEKVKPWIFHREHMLKRDY